MSNKTDSEITQQVIREWITDTGPALSVAPALLMLRHLLEGYGDRFSLDSACEALQSLSQNCDSIRCNLIEVKAAEL